MKTIMIVDDVKDTVDMVQKLLESEGYNTMTASNGEEALKLLKKVREKPDLVILDMFMPMMSGREVCERIRKDDELKDLKIAIVIEAWMSENIDLLYRSVGKNKDEMAEKYDPGENLKALHELYPQSCVYLSMLSFKQDWKEILPRLET